MLCIFRLVKNVSCQSKPQRVAAEVKAKQAYSPNTSLSYVISLWTEKQRCLPHVTNITNVFYHPCGAKDSSHPCLFKMSEEGKWSDDMWRMEIKRFHQLIIGQLYLKTNIIQATRATSISTALQWLPGIRQKGKESALWPCISLHALSGRWDEWPWCWNPF